MSMQIECSQTFLNEYISIKANQNQLNSIATNLSGCVLRSSVQSLLLIMFSIGNFALSNYSSDCRLIVQTNSYWTAQTNESVDASIECIENEVWEKFCYHKSMN